MIFTDLQRLPSLGTEVFADGFGVHAGGGAFITAAHLSALGQNALLASMLPASPLLDLMREELVASGVDLALSATLPAGHGPQLTVAMVHSGERAFLSRKAGAAYPMMRAQDLAARNVRHLHVGEIASLLEQPDIIGLARSAGITISVDCGWDDTLDPHALRALAGMVDVFLPNEAEWDLVRELGLNESFAPTIIVKLGSKGARAITAQGHVDIPTEPLEAVDTTGAGDAFNAGFLASWLSGKDIETSVAAGNIRGANCLNVIGGVSLAAEELAGAGAMGK